MVGSVHFDPFPTFLNERFDYKPSDFIELCARARILLLQTNGPLSPGTVSLAYHRRDIKDRESRLTWLQDRSDEYWQHEYARNQTHPAITAQDMARLENQIHKCQQAREQVIATPFPPRYHEFQSWMLTILDARVSHIEDLLRGLSAFSFQSVEEYKNIRLAEAQTELDRVTARYQEASNQLDWLNGLFVVLGLLPDTSVNQ